MKTPSVHSKFQAVPVYVTDFSQITVRIIKMIFQCYPIISMQKNTRIQDRSLVDIVEFTCGITQSMQLFSLHAHIPNSPGKERLCQRLSATDTERVRLLQLTLKADVALRAVTGSFSEAWLGSRGQKIRSGAACELETAAGTGGLELKGTWAAAAKAAFAGQCLL